MVTNVQAAVTFLVEVGFTVRRPVVPDERTAWVSVAGDSALDAHLVAAQVVATNPTCEMVTSTRIVSAA